MAIGDTVQAGLMRIDTSAYERAGQANANANMAFGNALNQVAKGFIEGQEKKARAEEMTGYLMNQGVSEKDAKAIAKNPFLQKEYQRKKATEAQMQMEGNRLQMEAQKLAAQQKQSSDQAFQKNREMDMKEELFRTEQDKIREDKESATNIAKFNLDRPELPITEETPAAFLPELDPDPFVGPPTTYQGQAPAVAQLPESFQPQGAQVVDAVQSGQLSLLEGNRIMDSIRGQAMAEQKAGPTRSEILAREKFEYEKAIDAEENKPIPPADPVYQQSALDAIDDAISYVKKDSIINPTVGFLSDTAKGIGGTDAANLDAALSTITSSVGFDRLQAMRDASPTGGALGQVSENELRQLNASLGSISQRQDDEQLLKNLEKIKAQYSSAVKAIEAQRRAYKMGKSFKTKEEALEFMESQSPDTGGIKTSTQGNYKIGDLSVGGYQPGQ
jgi:hypothetical protein